MIKELNTLIQKNIRQSKKNKSYKKIIKIKNKNLVTTKLSTLSF